MCSTVQLSGVSRASGPSKGPSFLEEEKCPEKCTTSVSRSLSSRNKSAPSPPALARECRRASSRFICPSPFPSLRGRRNEINPPPPPPPLSLALKAGVPRLLSQIPSWLCLSLSSSYVRGGMKGGEKSKGILEEESLPPFPLCPGSL